MGYESKLFIINRRDHGFGVYGQKLAELDMCNMGCNKDHVYFNEIFKNMIDFDLYEIDYDKAEDEEDFRVDSYGKHCCWATIDEVVSYMKGLIEDGETYWRLKPAIATLEAWKAVNTGLSDDPIVVHWGY